MSTTAMNSATQSVSERELNAMLATARDNLADLGHVPADYVCPCVGFLDANHGSTMGTCARTWDGFAIRVARELLHDREGMWIVLYHEMIHTLPGCFNHGKTFKAIARQVSERYHLSVGSRYWDADYRNKMAAAGISHELTTRELDDLINGAIGTTVTFQGTTYVVDGVVPGCTASRKARMCIHNSRDERSYTLNPTAVVTQLTKLQGKGDLSCAKKQPRLLADDEILSHVGDKVHIDGLELTVKGIKPRAKVKRMRVTDGRYTYTCKATSDMLFY